MSIQSEINRIKSNVSDCFAAVKETGMEVTSTATSDNLAASVRTAFDEVNDLLDQINGVVI